MPAERLKTPLRIVVLEPAPGVAAALQSGKAGKAKLVPPDQATPAALVFDFHVVAERAGQGARLTGPCVQGPPNGRFVYINWGAYAGDSASPWNGRTKVPLEGLDWALIDAVPPGGRLEASIAGKGRSGGPAFATVPLTPPGWRAVPASDDAP
ncbi:MAG: DUF5990 family protein [Caulobacteraceae bacterium]